MSAIHPDPKKGTRGGPAILTALYDIGAKHAIENFGSGFMPHQLSIVSGLIIFVGSGLIEGRIQDDLAQRLVFFYEPVSGGRLPERHHPVYAGTDFPAGGGFE